MPREFHRIIDNAPALVAGLTGNAGLAAAVAIATVALHQLPDRLPFDLSGQPPAHGE